MASAKQKKREKHSLSDLKKLGHQLLTSRAHINNLPLLITYVTPSTPSQYVLESLLSLESFFITVLPDLPPSSFSRGSLSSCKAEVDPEVVYRTWLRLKFDELINSLIEIAISTGCDETLREVALDTFMEFVKLGHGGSFYSAIYHKLLHKIVCSDLAVEYLLEVLTSKYFKYIDVCYFTYISMDKFAKILETRSNSGDASDKNHSEVSLAYSINKIHFIISHIPPLGSPEKTNEYENWSESGIKEGTKHLNAVKSENKQLQMEKTNKNGFPSSSKMRVKFTKAWMSFLRLPLPLDVYKEVLVYLHQTVIPYLSNPVMLCDFLTRSYDIGGVVSVMALSSLYILMTQHGLEYPNFYEKLYALLVPSVFMAKHRAKFLELLDSCLKSPLLPAYLAAAFAKKLSRLALAVPPSGELIITALVYNLLRRHPSINCLIHQDGNANSQEDTSAVVESVETEKDNGSSVDMPKNKQGVDLFKIDECDPLKSNALGSSLWELDTLHHHYCPPVSRFVETLQEDLTNKRKTTEINIKDFSSASYSTIFREEMRRRVKQVPLEFYNKIPSSLFSESDFPQWSFKFEGSEEGNTIDDQNCLLSAPEDCNGNSVKRQRSEVH